MLTETNSPFQYLPLVQVCMGQQLWANVPFLTAKFSDLAMIYSYTDNSEQVHKILIVWFDFLLRGNIICSLVHPYSGHI